MVNHLWLVPLLLHFALPQTTDKYSDEDRPYKFGFNIQGYQHRQEEKDEKGLIKGEYGFITADGYYRVTVYATDENGDFRIISMKNYYVGFPPEDPTTTPGPSVGRARQPQLPSFSDKAQGPTGRALDGDKKNERTPKTFTRPQGLAACSDCSIPTTTQRVDQPQGLVNKGDFRTGSTGGGNSGSGFGQGPAGGQGQGRGQEQFPQRPTGGSGQIPEQKQFQSPARAQGPAGRPNAQFSPGQLQQEAPRTLTQFPGSSGGNTPSAPNGPFNGGLSPTGRGGFNPNTRGGSFGSPEGISKGPNDFTQINQLDGTPKRRPQIGEIRDGLPPGVTVNDIKDLLYTFNYTVGFHGHHEDGFRNGDKQGDYFFDGRDGVERKVEYLANEFGYQPNITLIDLPENDVRRPNEQTEKEYGLKGYEFKWFYRK